MTTAAARGRWPRDLWMAAGVTAVALVVVLGLWISYTGWPPPPPFLLRDLPFGLVLGMGISIPAFRLMPFVMARVWHKHAVIRWLAALATMLVCAVVGTALAATVPIVIGMPSGMALEVFRENIRGTIPTTIVVGVIITIIGSAHARLEATELALRTQQLERERAEKVAAEARLASLASRVQPHFLFNTLNAISALIHDDPARAERTVERLSSLLRASLDARDVIALDQELKLVTDYLEIQRTRLEDRLRYDVSTAPDALALVPPLSVQTLVENAVTHVARHRPAGVTVHISAVKSGDEVHIDVADDGPGFDAAAVRAGHGLDTVQSRLRAIHGERAGLDFVRESGRMTVRLRVPVA